MKLIMYLSAFLAILSLISYLLLAQTRVRKGARLSIFLGSTLIYLVFFSTSLYTHFEERATNVLAFEAREQIKSTLPILHVKTEITPRIIYKGDEVNLTFIVINNTNDAFKDLKMNFAEGRLQQYFDIKDIKASREVFLIENILNIGKLDVGKIEKIKFVIIPKDSVEYIAEVFLQEGKINILDMEDNPITSIIEMKVNERS